MNVFAFNNDIYLGYGEFRKKMMKNLSMTLVIGCAGLAFTQPCKTFAQEAPEVIDSYPKQILKQRAERRRAEREAARAAAEASLSQSSGTVSAGSSPSGIEMVIINSGSGKLGSPDFERKRARFENPMRDTLINYRFEVSKYEITFDQWDKCVSEGGCGGHKPDDKGWGRGDRPVINVSYDDAQNFLNWLNQKTGQNYRLLSEAEWEYVARAGQDGPFGTGFDMSAKFANFDGKAPYGSGEKGPYLE